MELTEHELLKRLDNEFDDVDFRVSECATKGVAAIVYFYEEKIVYGHTKQSLEDEMPTVSEDQHITEINFNANDMESLCRALNNTEED